MKRLETQAIVAQMKEKLRVMGMLDASAAVKSELEDVEPEAVSTATASSAPLPPGQRSAVSEVEVFFPPAPPPLASQQSGPTNNEHSNLNIIEELKARTDRHRSVLSELEKAKQAAADSFNDLLQLRSSLQSSCSPRLDDLTSLKSDDVLEQSVAEVDTLLNMFRESLSTAQQSNDQSLPTPSLGRSRSSQSGSLRSSVFGYSLQQSVDDTESIAPILEKYSDKLLEIMTRKMNESLLPSSKS
mmetsp:Transcript_2044/g.3223  ORF Transcript_2044/g.3223 Transcript_2044/m.3223 type:complete len:243 (-) Transcript_2044:2950-3678(-)